jgi:hypothetical protein
VLNVHGQRGVLSGHFFFALGEKKADPMSEFKLKNLGIGLGLRRENSSALARLKPDSIDVLEVAPENYFHTGGKLFREFCELAERYPVLFHGISLSLGSLKPLDMEYLTAVKEFIGDYQPLWFSDHLCYSSVMGAQFHSLLPLPFTEEAIHHVVPRIQRVQDYLGMPLAIENISYYAAPAEPQMTEWEFVREVAERSDCGLLLDVNNIYVNAVNFNFDPMEYLRAVPLERVMHVHVAGHRRMEDFVLDTHGAPVVDPVWDLLSALAARTDLPAVIIERDSNLPELGEQLAEVERARERVARGAAVLPSSQKKAGGGR